MQSEKLRRERDRVLQNGGVPNFSSEEITGQYDGDELRQARATLRTPDQRIDHLEVKHDALVRDVTETRVIVGEMKGKLDVLPELVKAVQSVAERGQQREHVTFTAQVDVEKAEAQAQIEIDKAKAIAAAEITAATEKMAVKVKGAQVKDEIEERASKRKRWTYIIGGSVGLASVLKHVIEYVGQLIHWIGGRL